MTNITLALEVPKDVYLALQSAGVDRAEMEARATRELAVQLFADGRLSMGKASKMAGMTMRSFWDYLVSKKIPVFNYAEEDLENDLNVAKNWREDLP